MEDHFINVLRGQRVSSMMPLQWQLRNISEWWSTARRRRPFHRDQVSREFWVAVKSFDPFDGWVEVMGVLGSWWGGKCCETVRGEDGWQTPGACLSHTSTCRRND